MFVKNVLDERKQRAQDGIFNFSLRTAAPMYEIDKIWI